MQEVSLDEAVTMAIAFQRRGQLEEAEQVYDKVLDVAPDHAVALHYAGVLAHQQGRSQQAAELIERSLELGPEQADWYNNLGIVYKAQGRVDEAVVAYRRAIDLDPDHANAHSNLGVLLKAQGKPAEAEQAYREAIRLNPDHIDAYHNLGVLLASLKRTKEAVRCYCKVTTLSPKHPEARRLLALAHCTLGEPEKAAAIFTDWLQDEPDNVVARHMLAACSGRDVPVRASDRYVEKTFDDFASSFDAKLANLSYRAPSVIAAVVADSGAEPAKALDVLDAGCGTGLCGPLIAPYARRLVGVDLSARMLEQARGKVVYDELVKSELTDYLRRSKAAFDLIVSSDTLVYFGALDSVVGAAAEALRPGGLFVFTLEAALEGQSEASYRLQPHGRYTHAQRYVEQVLADAGLSADVVRAELRMESGSPVEGLVVQGTKPRRVSDA